jgi:HSP20 family protein
MARHDIERDADELQALFTDLWQGSRFRSAHGGFRPNVDSYHTDDPHELTVVVELPGVDPETIAVVVGERMLVVAGQRARPRAEGLIYQRMEIEYGPFERRVRLAEDVDPTRARAEYMRGILRISLPVTGAPTPRGRVSITVALP